MSGRAMRDMPMTASGPFVGRSTELAALLGVLTDPADTAQVALVEGEAGIGKTRLLDEAVRFTADRGLPVCRASADYLARNHPFRTVVEALGLEAEHDEADARRVLTLLGRPSEDATADVAFSPGPVVYQQVLEALVRLVELRALRQPTAIVLDDVHWADAETLMTIGAVVRRLGDLPVRILLSYRPWPQNDVLEALADQLVEQDAHHIQLQPLQEESVAKLVGGLLAATPGPQLRTFTHRAAGNPLWLIELLDGLRASALLRPVNDGIELERLEVPPSFRVTLLRRLTHVSPQAVDMLRVASVLGPSFDLRGLSAVLGRSTAELLPELDEALRAGVLREDGSLLAFRHDLIREAIYDDLPEAVQASLHLDVGRALGRAGASSLDVAEHLAKGALPGDMDAVGWLADAARQVAPSAPRVAVQLLEKALAIAGSANALVDELTADLVNALVWAGRVVEAERLARRALADHGDLQAAERLRVGLVQSLFVQGRIIDAREEAESSLAALAQASELLPQVAVQAGFTRLFAGDFGSALVAAEVGVDAGEGGRDDTAVVMGRCVKSLVRMFQGDAPRAVTLATEAVERAHISRERGAARFGPRLFLGLALADNDDLDAAEQVLQRGLELSEEAGTAWNLPLFHWTLAELAYISGRFDDALAEVTTGERLSRESGARLGSIGGDAVVARIAVHRQRRDTAEAALARCDAEIGSAGAHPSVPWALWTKSFFEESRGQPDAALEILQGLYEVCVAVGAPSPLGLIAPDLVRLAAAAGRTEIVREVTRLVGHLADEFATTSLRLAALTTRALADHDPNVALMAADLADKNPSCLKRAGTYECMASVLATSANPGDAIRLLEAALQVFEGLGASFDVQRLDARLRELGVRRGRRGERAARPRAGWESLTATERRVAELVGDGLTNPQVGRELFVSPRTVETHLGRVFTKLGINSRAKLISLLASGTQGTP